MWRYYLVWFKNFFIMNLLKFSLIIGSLIAFYYLGSFDDLVSYERLITSGVDKVGGDVTYLYIVEGKSINYKIIESGVKLRVVEGYLEVYEYHWANILLLAFIIISFIVVFLMTIFGDFEDGVGWEFDLVSYKSLNYFIHCELEAGKFYYLAFGRLLGIEDKKLRGELLRNLGVSGLGDVKKCSKFKTKQRHRWEKLKSLGI